MLSLNGNMAPYMMYAYDQICGIIDVEKRNRKFRR